MTPEVKIETYQIEVSVNPEDLIPVNIYEVDVYDGLILSVREIQDEDRGQWISPPKVGDSIDEMWGGTFEKLTL